MEIIPFQNGEKIKDATVEINDITYTVKDAEYKGDTPLSAENLNQMQNNINEAIESIKTKQEQYTKTYSTKSTQNVASTYPYRKILTIKLSKAYETIFFKFTAAETENVGCIFNGEVLASLDVNKNYRQAAFYGSYTAKSLENMKMMLINEDKTTGNVTLGLYCYLPYNWRTVQLDVLGGIDLDAISEDNSYFSSEPENLGKTEI